MFPLSRITKGKIMKARNKWNSDRYTAPQKVRTSIAEISADGDWFTKYTTVSGKELFSKFPNNIKLNQIITIKINYDRYQDKWRLEVL